MRTDLYLSDLQPGINFLSYKINEIGKEGNVSLFADERIVNFSKYVGFLFGESYKTLLKHIKEGMNKWGKILSMLLDWNLVVFFLPNAPKPIHKFSAVPANIPTGFLTMQLVKLIIVFIW